MSHKPCGIPDTATGTQPQADFYREGKSSIYIYTGGGNFTNFTKNIITHEEVRFQYEEGNTKII